MAALTDEQKAALEAENEQRRQEIEAGKKAEPASATTPRSRQATSYIVLTVDGSGFKTELEHKPEARSPQHALEAVKGDLPDDCEIVVVVPASSYHVFIRTTAFEAVK